MSRIIRHILALAALWMAVAGCNIWGDYGPEDGMSELSISVSVSNTPAMPTKAVDVNPNDYIGALNDGEKIQTLRIVIVRENGVIEHNRYLDFYGDIQRAYTEVNNIIFKVYGPETKEVYLFVNENTLQTAVSGGTKKLVDYDFDALTPGSAFPEEEISSLLVTLTQNDEEVPLALPMSEHHTIEMPASDYHADLYVTRASTKFTYIFDNQSNVDLSLEGLTISKASRKEYYMPRVTYTGIPLTSTEYSVDDYEVPNVENNEYYVFRKTYQGGVSIPANTVTSKLADGSPINLYLLEGKYTDAASDGKNYSMSVTLNGTVYSSYFPELPQLPRNTHVVVLISFKDYGTGMDVHWTVDVYPYEEVWLEPGFGQ